jgi:hypothetical protein
MILTRKIFHDCCKRLREDVKLGNIDTRFGICTNLVNKNKSNMPVQIVYEFHDMVAKYAKGWHKHSGEAYFPVTPFNHYKEIRNKWKDQVGKDRMELLNYLIRNTR